MHWRWIFFLGKSALHWAAAVNNVEAAIVLLKNGANKDMQNNKVFTAVHDNTMIIRVGCSYIIMY